MVQPRTQEDRLAKAKAKAQPPVKPEPKVQDQKDQAKPSGDQKPTKKTIKKKPSNTVKIWRDLIKAKACTTGSVHFTDEFRGKNPKRGKAATRYSLYKDGMSVEDYVEVSHKAGNAKAQAQTDVRWDVASGFITVSGKTAEQLLATDQAKK